MYFLFLPIIKLMNLPILDSSFFKDQSPSKDFLEKWKNQGPWSPFLVPVYEWNEFVYLACTSAPIQNPPEILHTKNTHKGKPVKWVLLLAAPQFVLNIWESLNDLSSDSELNLTSDFNSNLNSEAEADSDFQSNLKMDSDENQENSGFDADSSADADSNADGESDSDSESDDNSNEDLHIPEGLVGIEMPKSLKTKKTGNGNKQNEILEGFESFNLNNSVDEANKTSLTDLSTKSSILPKKDSIKEQAAPAARSSGSSLQKEKISSNFKNELNDGEDHPNNINNLTKTRIPSPIVQKQNKSDNEYKNEMESEPLTSTTIKSMSGIFEKLKSHFKSSMILFFNNGQFKALEWSSDLKPKNSNTTVEIEEASVFRIVQKTLKPYHGYVVPNEINETFFNNWNHGQIPDHLTIIPICPEDELRGILLCIGEISANNKTSLSFAERIAEEIGSGISSAA